MNKENTCVNCGHQFDDPYCPKCGQKVLANRYTLSFVFQIFFHNIFNFESGFWLTSKYLLIQPSKVILPYLKGNTTRFFNPLKLFFFYSFIQTFLVIQFGLFDLTIDNMSAVMKGDPVQAEAQQELMETIKNYMSIISLLNVPMMAIGLFLLFKKQGFNYAEHIIMSTYIYAGYMLIKIPVTVLFIIQKNWIDWYTPLDFFFLIIYMSFTLRTVFKLNWFLTIVKGIVGFALGILILVVSSIILSIAYMLIRSVI